MSSANGWSGAFANIWPWKEKCLSKTFVRRKKFLINRHCMQVAGFKLGALFSVLLCIDITSFAVLYLFLSPVKEFPSTHARNFIPLFYFCYGIITRATYNVEGPTLVFYPPVRRPVDLPRSFYLKEPSGFYSCIRSQTNSQTIGYQLIPLDLIGYS